MNSLSRRGFLKGAAVGGAALTFGARLAFAEQLMTGRTPSVEEIRGTGVAPGLVRMNLNENPIGPSPLAVKAISENMFDINRYGSGEGALVRALAAFDEVKLPTREEAMKALMEQMGNFAGAREMSREEMQQMIAMAQSMGMDLGFSGPYLITAGSSHALDLLTMAYFSREGGEIIEAAFGYGDISRTVASYKQIFGVETNAIKAPMTKGYRHDLDAMLSAITPKTKMVVITNPNNPTGTLLSFEEIERFVRRVPSNVIVVVDEAYIHFAEGDRLPSAIPLATSMDNVVVVRTFSKIYAMPAMRLGYAVASPKIKQEMQKYNKGGQNGANKLANVAGTAAVEDIDHIQRSRQAVMDFKKRCYAEFDKMGLEYLPSQSNFMMVNLGRPAMPVVMEMGKRKVNISFRQDAEFKNWMRVSSGTMPETEVFLSTLREVLASKL
jgi:histidinol-phosphate aminotransferase